MTEVADTVQKEYIRTLWFILPPVRSMEEILREVAKMEGFSEKVSVELVGSELGAGTHFHGRLTRARLREEGAGERSLELVLKSAPSDPLTREVVSAKEKFSNEVFFYREILPVLRRHGELPTVPRLVWSSLKEGSELLVLEDLGPGGYSPVSIREGLEGERLTAATRALDKLHAASSSLSELEPGLFASLASGLTESFCAGHYFRGTASKCAENARRIAEEYLGVAVRKRLEVLDIVNELESVARPDTSDLVITHGDVWASNILFKYHPNGLVADVALVDWQMTRLGPGVLDHSSLAFTSTKCAHVLEGGTSRFGLWIAVILLPFALGQAEQALVFTPERLVFSPDKEADLRIAGVIAAAARANLI